MFDIKVSYCKDSLMADKFLATLPKAIFEPISCESIFGKPCGRIPISHQFMAKKQPDFKTGLPQVAQ